MKLASAEYMLLTALSCSVSHLAGQLARSLRRRQPELDITDQDILCVEIAGLCHDLGSYRVNVIQRMKSLHTHQVS